MKKTEYQKKLDKMLTPEFVDKWKKARAERLEKVKESLEGEDELFLEQLKEWLDEYLDECYSRDD